MKQISLSEFKRLTLLSDASLVYLLEKGQLSCIINHNNQLLIDIDKLENRQIVDAILNQSKNLVEDQADLLEQKIARIVAEYFDAVVNESLAKL